MKLNKAMIGIGVLILFWGSIASCRSVDSKFDIRENFTGKFTGEVEFHSPEDSIWLENALVEVSYENEQHGIHFPSSIPSIYNIEFEDNGEVLMNVGADSLHLIRITKESLIVVYQDEDTEEFWSAKCLRN